MQYGLVYTLAVVCRIRMVKLFIAIPVTVET